jgi:hypothetical protein
MKSSFANLRCAVFLLLLLVVSMTRTGFAATETAPQLSTLFVSVADAENHGFVADAQVRLPEIGKILRTDWQGEVRFPDLKPGRYQVEVHALGYAPSEVQVLVKGDTAGVFFELEKVSNQLDTVKVTAPKIGLHLEEFEMRRKMGIGRFITDSVLYKEGNHALLIVLETRFPGVVHAPDGSNKLVPRRGTTYFPRNTKSTFYRNINGVDVYLDGMLYGDSLPPGLLPSDISGAELYPMGMAPAQYRRGSGASHVLLLWSRY